MTVPDRKRILLISGSTRDGSMNKAALLEGDARLQAWADVDKMIIQDAAGIPFIWDKTTLVRSKNVVGVGNPYIALWDLSYISIK